jgi:hypothetical protein
MSFQTLYRLVVMAGTVVVATMAWRVYGPPADQLQPLWGRAQQAIAEFLKPATGEQMSKGEPPAPFDESATGLVPLAESDRRVDSAVGPAGWNEPPQLAETRPTISSSPAEVEGHAVSEEDNLAAGGEMSAVYERLRQLGVEQYGLSPWGTTPGLYRFRCSAPWGSEGLYHRYFEAVSGNPVEAAQRVLADVERWQTSQAGRTTPEIR